MTNVSVSVILSCFTNIRGIMDVCANRNIHSTQDKSVTNGWIADLWWCCLVRFASSPGKGADVFESNVVGDLSGAAGLPMTTSGEFGASLAEDSLRWVFANCCISAQLAYIEDVSFCCWAKIIRFLWVGNSRPIYWQDLSWIFLRLF